MPSPPTHSGFLWKLVCYSLDRKLYPFENERDRRHSLNSLTLLSSQNADCISKNLINGARKQQPLTLTLVVSRPLLTPSQGHNYPFPPALSLLTMKVKDFPLKNTWSDLMFFLFFFYSPPKLSFFLLSLFTLLQNAPCHAINVDSDRFALSFSRRTERITFWPRRRIMSQSHSRCIDLPGVILESFCFLLTFTPREFFAVQWLSLG